ncbi:hypothetical protein HNR47_002364 [Methylopila jiangsuensis]|uniref:DUF2155 domain-containing protein n=1 Tax=Methylopila jiangsuensis TaxID=586230 RepID=UPI0022F3070E|nr:DUF2155 domain-containing protein [Methylopila jiangsuensis]MDR6286363.1 hypothetical protein [Methylopila jiangsuensis]
MRAVRRLPPAAALAATLLAPAAALAQNPGTSVAPAPRSGQGEVIAPTPRIENPVAVFNGLDKITGRITEFDVPIEKTVAFGALKVTPHVCYTRPPTEQPNTTSYVDVDELSLKNEQRRIFSGWMFASSPGLSSVEHPIYDVWLIDCKGGARPEAPQGPTLGE